MALVKYSLTVYYDGRNTLSENGKGSVEQVSLSVARAPVLHMRNPTATLINVKWGKDPLNDKPKTQGWVK